MLVCGGDDGGEPNLESLAKIRGSRGTTTAASADGGVTGFEPEPMPTSDADGGGVQAADRRVDSRTGDGVRLESETEWRGDDDADTDADEIDEVRLAAGLHVNAVASGALLIAKRTNRIHRHPDGDERKTQEMSHRTSSTYAIASKRGFNRPDRRSRVEVLTRRRICASDGREDGTSRNSSNIRV